MNKNIIQEKLDYLHELLDKADGNQQVQYLSEEIDYYKTQLLKTETSEHFRDIERNH